MTLPIFYLTIYLPHVNRKCSPVSIKFPPKCIFSCKLCINVISSRHGCSWLGRQILSGSFTLGSHMKLGWPQVNHQVTWLSRESLKTWVKRNLSQEYFSVSKTETIGLKYKYSAGNSDICLWFDWTMSIFQHASTIHMSPILYFFHKPHSVPHSTHPCRIISGSASLHLSLRERSSADKES